ncbi:STAS/SEC14 domain-containing protein [Rivularia sp. UHCC 0363]|uniref:STAS/SEC14 domain-containing protein n=1 Tax=Rivularia sp. UHCC 0363 TaxID=3110244 RepID=UPI002B1FB4A8|nr:STAS/SEC14 domain-containing protein [Rivularia sp. UHCC 0363]MEA5597021.1 STAS/SEC14 domain-containing protein [Rivularia sp. UHCC 0363]
MLKLLSMDANSVIGVSIKGNVNTKDFDLVKNFIKEVEIHYEFLRIYVEIEDIEGFMLETLLKELEFTLTNFHRFEKEAIVIEKKWIEQIEIMRDIFVSSVKVEYFALEDKCKARCWILS